jgi:hypothetical protein
MAGPATGSGRELAMVIMSGAAGAIAGPLGQAAQRVWEEVSRKGGVVMDAALEVNPEAAPEQFVERLVSEPQLIGLALRVLDLAKTTSYAVKLKPLDARWEGQCCLRETSWTTAS